jgi:hypothetical protein
MSHLLYREAMMVLLGFDSPLEVLCVILCLVARRQQLLNCPPSIFCCYLELPVTRCVMLLCLPQVCLLIATSYIV